MKKFVKLIALALIVAVLTVSAAFADSTARTLDEIKESGTLTVGVFSDKKPFGYVDENGDYQGYDVYFARRLARGSRHGARAGLGRRAEPRGVSDLREGGCDPGELYRDARARRGGRLRAAVYEGRTGRGFARTAR